MMAAATVIIQIPCFKSEFPVIVFGAFKQLLDHFYKQRRGSLFHTQFMSTPTPLGSTVPLPVVAHADHTDEGGPYIGQRQDLGV